MSFISLEKPITMIEFYKITDDIPYLCEDFTIFLFLDGHCKINDLNYTSEDILLLPPGHSITIQPGDSVVVCTIQFNNYLLLTATNNFDLFAEIHESPSNVRLKETIGSLQNLIRSHRSGLVSHYYFQFVEDLLRLYPSVEENLSFTSDSPKAREILEYVHSNLIKPLTLNGTAEHVQLTPQYLASFFRKHYSMTFKEYVNRQKAQLSIPLLKYTLFSEEAVAGILGYPSAVSLNHSLQNITGKTARQIRNESLLPCKNITIPSQYILANHERYMANPSNLIEPSDKTTETKNIQNFELYNLPEYAYMSTSWKKILNIGRISNMGNSEFRRQLIFLQKEVHYTYGRIQDLPDEVTIHEINNQVFYGFEDIFKTLDILLDINLTPFIVLGNHYKPSMRIIGDKYLIQSSEPYQTYYQKLYRILPIFIKSCCNRYGLEEVSNWHFEICYDYPNRSGNRQTIFQFLTTYQRLEKMIHTYVPACKVGGPGFNSILPTSEFESMLKNIKVDNIPFDFISYFVYGNKDLTPESNIFPTGSILVDRARDTASLISQYIPKARIYMTEYGPFWNKRNYLSDSIFLACTLAWFCTTNMELVDAMGYCMISDIATDYADSRGLLFGGQGLFNYLGLRKPAYYMFHFMNQLGPIKLNNHPGLILTSKSKYNFQALMYHCPGLTPEATVSRHCKEIFESDSFVFEPLAPKQLNLTLNDMVPGCYLIKEYRLNRESGNLLREFGKIRDITDLIQTDLDCLQALSVPRPKLSTIEVGPDGVFQSSIIIHSLEVILLHIDYNNKGESYELQ